jgi:hypothetical protein
MEYSGARGKMIPEKKSNISCQTLFMDNILVHNIDAAAR